MARDWRRARDENRLQLVLSNLPERTSGRNPPVLFLTVGLPCTGKSTFSRKLAPAIGAAVLESDALRQMLFPMPVYSQRENHIVFNTLHAAARSLLEEGVSVIVDATSIKERDRLPLYRLADATDARLLIACFDAPRTVIEQRLEARARTLDPSDRSTADIMVYEYMAEAFSLPGREHWRIDTSDAAATEAALAEITACCLAGSAVQTEVEEAV